jgi:hypothetical protein
MPLASPESSPLPSGSDVRDHAELALCPSKRYLTAINPEPVRFGDDTIICGIVTATKEITMQTGSVQFILTIHQAQELGAALFYASNRAIYLERARTANPTPKPRPARAPFWRWLLSSAHLDASTATPPEAKP